MKRLAILLLALPMAANAIPITYNYSTTLSNASDPFGIDGETISLSLLFDTDDQWGSHVGGLLMIEGQVQSVSITGGNSISVKNNSVALLFQTIANVSTLSEALDNSSFMDFVINGIEFVTFGNLANCSPASLIPSVGDNLDVGHITLCNGFVLIQDTNNQNSHTLTNSAVSVSVPEPGTLALFGIGLFGIGLARRRRTQ